MLIGYGDNNILLIAITDAEVEKLRAGEALPYHGLNLLTKDVFLMWGRDKEHVLEQLRTGGVRITEKMIDDYRHDRPTDKPPKDN
jgi:hypothetical protein